MPKDEGKRSGGTVVAAIGIIGGTIIAVAVPYFAMVNPSTGSYGFVLAFLAIALGASAVIAAVASKKN